jgi:hypothetical protein
MKFPRLATIIVGVLLLLSSAHGFAGAVSPCQFPHIFSDVDVNIVILPFATTTPDHRYKDIGAQLALLMKLETLYDITDYGSVGVTLLAGNAADCDPEKVRRQIDLAKRRANSAVVFLWGRVFEQAGQIYVQSNLSFLRGNKPETWMMKIAGQDFEGALSGQTFSFAAQRLVAGDLMEISQNYLASSILYESPDVNSPVTSFSATEFWKCVGCGQNELAYHIVGRTGPWLEVVTIDGKHGYFRADIQMGTWRLDAKLPELSFINGLVGYLSNVIQHSENTSMVVQQLKQYGLTTKYVDDQSRSVALQLTGILEARREQAAEINSDFGRAFSFLNTSGDARNCAAMASFLNHRCGRKFESDLLDAAVLDPKNPYILANLEALYQLMLGGFASSGAAPACNFQYSSEELKRRLASVQRLRKASEN